MDIYSSGIYVTDLDIDNVVNFCSCRVRFVNVTPPVSNITWCHFVCIPMNKIENVEARQEIYTHQGEAYYRIKWDGAWKPWRRLDNFGCNTPADLASLLGANSYVTLDNNTSDKDMNNYTQYGKYRCTVPNPSNIGFTNIPENHAFWLYVQPLSGTTNYPVQYFVVSYASSPAIYFRQYNTSNSIWYSWVRIDSFGCSTASELASLLGAASPQIVEIAVGGQETVAVSGTTGFILARENFYNSFGALWYFHGGTCKAVYEEDQVTLSATNATARLYVSTGSSSGSSTITIKNNHSGTAKLHLKIIVM